MYVFQELRKALQHLQGELHSRNQQLHTLEMEKYNEIRIREQDIQHLHQSLHLKEQLLRVSSQMRARHPELSNAYPKAYLVPRVRVAERIK